MKNYLSLIAACAITLLGFNSCQSIETDTETEVYGEGIHKVTFSTQFAEETKTALELRIVPDWRNTPTSSIHLFETYNSSTVEGQNVTLESKEEDHYRKAYFTADFDESQSIIVTPPTKASSNTYVYNAIIGKKVDGKYVIPAVQEPDQEVSSLDPNADFLIGKYVESETRYQTEPLQIKFTRPVALARLAFYGLEAGKDEKILSVKLEAVAPLTGSVSYEDINFTDGTTTFDTTNGSNTITMNYGNGGTDQESVFYAYFITIPGTHKISSVSLTTDKYVYTKSFENPVSLSFDINNFKNIGVSMVGIKGKNNENPRLDQTIEWMKSSQAITSDSYDLASGNEYVAPVVNGAQTTLSYESSATGVATINEEGTISIVGVGETTIKATAAANDTYNSATASFVLTVTKTQASTVTYYKATILEAGYDYIVVSNGKAVKTSDTGKAESVDVTVENDKIVMAEDASIIWTCAKPQTTLTQGTYTLSNNGKSIYRISNSGNFSLGVNSTPESITKYYLWDYVNYHVTHTSTGNNTTYYYCFYYDSTDGWKFTYATTIAETNPTYLFTARAPQALSFTNAENAQIDLAAENKTFKATLDGAKTDVTYTSSNENVATVAADGTVTGVAKGTVTITAKAASTSEYQGAEATYSIEIVNTSAVVGYFTKIASLDEIVEGETYIITNTDATKAFKGILNGTTKFKDSENTVAVTLSDSKIADSDALAGCKLKFTKHATNAGKYYIKFNEIQNYYFYVNYNGTTFAANATQGYSQTITASNGNFTIVRDSYYLRYSSSNDKFYSNTTTSEVSIYKLVGGNTPDPGTPDPGTTKYYTKVTESLPSSGSQSNLLFVYDKGDGTGYAFKGSYSGTATVPSGSTDSNSAFLDTNNAVAVTITSDGIAKSDAVDACTMTMEFSSSNKHYVKMDGCGYWFRMLAEGTNNGQLVAMTSSGYRLTYSVSTSGTNNVTASRSSYYFGFDGTKFVGSSDSTKKFCIYKLSE